MYRPISLAADPERQVSQKSRTDGSKTQIGRFEVTKEVTKMSTISLFTPDRTHKNFIDISAFINRIGT